MTLLCPFAREVDCHASEREVDAPRLLRDIADGRRRAGD